MPVIFIKKLIALSVVAVILLSGVTVVMTTIEATELEPDGRRLFTRSNEVLPYPLHPVHLNNNPSPPTGDTNSQLNLPMEWPEPTGITLYNYDQDRDSEDGLVIDRGGNFPTETDPLLHQSWRTDPLLEDLVIDGVITLVIWSGLENFQNNKRGYIQAYLRDYDGATFTEITEGELNVKNWQAGSNTWVQRTLEFNSVNYTLPVGNQFEVKLVVRASAWNAMWFAYDTTTYDSILRFP